MEVGRIEFGSSSPGPITATLNVKVIDLKEMKQFCSLITVLMERHPESERELMELSMLALPQLDTGEVQ